MNILEKYSLTCGVRPEHPSVPVGYFPIPYDKYIVIDNRNKNSMNVYDMYSDVISYIYPILESQGIEIVSFCRDDKSLLEKTKTYISLSKKQEAYILSNSLLNIGSDNLSCYFSNALGVSSIGLYSIYPSQINKPIWSDTHTCIESDRCGNLPSYGVKEDPKAINFISPEVIAQKILEKIGIEHKIPFETIFIGDLYPIKVVEVIPDFAVSSSFMNKRALNLRMDYHFDEENMCRWLKDRYLNILTDQPINIDLLKYFKNNIVQITVNIEKGFSESYLKSIQQIGIKTEIFCETKNEINKYRFDFFDFDINENIWKSKEDAGEKVSPNTKFLTSKILLSNGKKYSCYEAKLQEKELTDKPEVIYDTPEFWKELDHYRLINEL